MSAYHKGAKKYICESQFVKTYARLERHEVATACGGCRRMPEPWKAGCAVKCLSIAAGDFYTPVEREFRSLNFPLCTFQCVVNEHGNGHGAHSAWNWGDEACCFLEVVKVCVAYKTEA